MEPSSKCRSCEAPIVWVKTRRGKKMPVDAEPDPAGLFVLEGMAGELVAHKAGPLDGAAGGELYTSHFATCPDGDQWRQRDDRAVTCSSCSNRFLNRRGKCPKCGAAVG